MSKIQIGDQVSWVELAKWDGKAGWQHVGTVIGRSVPGVLMIDCGEHEPVHHVPETKVYPFPWRPEE